jgi:O-antigen/teichoic acid export membrane protein
MRVWRYIKKLINTALFDHAAWMVGGSGLQAAVSFVGNLVLVWLLRPEDFGRFAVIQANIGVVAAIINFRVGEVVLKSDQGELNTYWNAFVSIQFIQMFLVVGLAGGILWWQGLLSSEAMILLTGATFGPWVTIYTKVYERKFTYKKISIVESGSHILAHIIAVLGAIAGLGAIVLYLRELFRIIGRFVGLAYLKALRSIKIQLPGLEDYNYIFQKIGGFWFDGVLQSSYNRLLIIAVEAYAGEKVAGYFFQAKRLAITPHQLLQSLTSRIAYNYFSHKVSLGRQRKVLLRTIAYEAGVLGLIGTGVLAFANPVIPWVFGKEWLPVVPILYAMFGVIVGITPFNTIKFYCMANSRLSTFIKTARIFQYISLVVAIGSITMWQVEPGIVLALSFSSGYVFGCIGILMTFIFEKDERLRTTGDG